MASVPQLVDDLCEALLPAAKAHSGQRRGSRKKAKQSLKRVAYNVLFTSLFQDETRKLQPGLPRLPVKNRILMLSFDLRVSGLGAEADRLEELVEELEAAHRRPLAELGSVLDLLVRLAGSGPPRMLRRRRDFFLHSRPVGRDVPYGGYDCADLSGLEADVRSLISGEEYLCRDLVRKTLQVMEAAPGTGLPAVGLFSYGDPCGDRFERDTRVSLFGALVHSRTADLDVRLDLPPVPDSADLSGLAIKVSSSVDQSEDEGFQSASNLTPDSQSEPGMTPDIDLWDAVLTYEASKRRCWEQVGCPPGHREEPYLTEAGRAAFDRSCRLCQAGLQVLGGGLLQAPQPVLVKECELVKDALNILIGVVSATFSLCQPAQAFTVKQGVHVSGASPESVSSLLSEVAECGTHYARLSHFSLQPVLDSSCSEGLVFQAFTSGLRRYLQYYRACVLSTPPTLSLLTIAFLFKKLGRQLRYLAELCGVGTGLLGAGGGAPGAAFPTGVKLLSYLYQEALDNCSNEHYPVLLSLLKTSCEPYTRFIHDWVYSGVFRDVYGEFMIQVNHEYLGFRDKFYWTHGYVLISKEVEDCVPVFLRHVAHDVYVCGKTINLLKLCCPRHYLCCSDVPVPRVSVIFSLEELKDIEKDCAIYVGRMERVARHSSISKEEKELRMEIAKQELIVQAREAASRVLSALSDRQLSERMALDAQKREQFQRLKEQFVKDQERRRAARQEELDDDFSYARELRDRQRRLKALEEQLERKARQALVDHYSKLSAEAARREQKALWKVQRHRLAGARLRFLLEDQKRVQELLEDMAEGKPLEPLAILPGARFQASFLGPEHPDGGGSCDPGHEGWHEAARDSPDRQSVLTPQPLEPPAAGACGSGPGAGPPSEQAEGPGPFSVGLSIRDFLPTAQRAEQPVLTSAAPVLDEALQTIGSDLPPLAPSAAADTGPSGPQEYDFRTILRPSVAAPASPGALQTAGGSLGSEGPRLREDTHVQLDTCVPDGRVALPYAHPPQHPSCQEESSQDPGQLCGQVAEPGVPTEGYASGMAPARPRWNVHGHVSDANIRVGENVWDVAPSRPRWNVHGHVSDASIRVGENVWDVAPSRPRWNVHGHVSQSSVMLGLLSGEAEPNVPGPPWAPPDHGSRSGLSLGAQSPAREDEPRLPAETASGGSGRGEETGLQDLLSAEAAPTALEDSIPEEPAEPPVARLLHHGLPRAFALPEDPGAQSDADASAVQLSELLPLPVLMKHSITAPLAAHVSLVNKAAVDYFFVELHLGAHFEALRHFLLMEDGEFAQSLSDLLFEKLGAGQTPGELLSPLVLNSVLSKALQYSLHGDTPHAANLSFALKFLPETFAPNAPDVLSCLELRYKVDWPLNIVVTEGCLSRYSGIFSFLLQLKLMMWTLKDVCFHLKRTARVSHAAGSVQFRQLQLFKHEMQHFVKVIQGYIANQILHVTWCEFQARLASVGDLEEIQRAHAEYLHKAVFRGLLTEKAAPVMNIIHSTFSLVLKFRSQLIAQPWRGPEHPNFALLQQSYSTFKYYSHFLFKVVSKLVNRGYQPHLEDFLLRINFNSYYQDA
ncbi:gamma-tubulin complex component 6 isoform X7 [Lagenorhynchus albirostris]|uniref:gamma-tubulin complex component 6 isoform X7 n=1 Tax=Lagenorhynchus albirostris TaxID=27610 RepID=UPI0028EA847D|nr:gamma-tubulin complex component 6 isoform X7 [Lagenorhynchus albirostris]